MVGLASLAYGSLGNGGFSFAGLRLAPLRSALPTLHQKNVFNLIGKRYSLSALYAAYEHSDSAETIAKWGVEAGIEFNVNSAAPITSYRIELIQ